MSDKSIPAMLPITVSAEVEEVSLDLSGFDLRMYSIQISTFRMRVWFKGLTMLTIVCSTFSRSRSYDSSLIALHTSSVLFSSRPFCSSLLWTSLTLYQPYHLTNLSTNRVYSRLYLSFISPHHCEMSIAVSPYLHCISFLKSIKICK